jgi:hypothetical protein
MRRSVVVWRGLVPLVRRFLGESGLSFNALVNLALERFLGGCGVPEELRLRAELYGLLRREAELRRVQNCMLRSGAFLGDYARRRLGKPVGPPRPLAALDGREARVFEKICGERERVAGRIVEVMERLLRDAEPLRLDEGSRVKKGEGGEKRDE